MYEDIIEIRILPMSKEEFSSLEDVRSFLFQMTNDNKGIYDYRSKAIDFKGNTLVLFQYDNHIIGCAKIIDKVETIRNINGIEYNGYYELSDVKVLNALINSETLKKIDSSFNGFNQTTRKFDLKFKDEIIKCINKIEHQSKIDYLNDKFDVLYPRVIVCNIGWMEKYAGMDNDSIKNGGSYTKEMGFGHEVINFLSDNGYYRGFANSGNQMIDLGKIDMAAKNLDKLEDVLVVFCAKDKFQTIVGYYNHATVYRHIQKRPNDKYEGYFFETKVINGKLLPISKRNFEFDKEKQGKPGESNIWYARGDVARKQRLRILEYIDSIINEKDISNDENIIKDLKEDESDEVYQEGENVNKGIITQKRNLKARQKCIDKNGYICHVCGVDLKQVYGEIAKNFIHIHHINFLSDNKTNHSVNPINDLIPVCPNCHAMLHRRLNGKYLNIEELKNEISKAKIFVGMEIIHPLYSKGVIKQISNDTAVAYFPSKGELTIRIDYINEKCQKI